MKKRIRKDALSKDFTRRWRVCRRHGRSRPRSTSPRSRLCGIRPASRSKTPRRRFSAPTSRTSRTDAICVTFHTKFSSRLARLSPRQRRLWRARRTRCVTSARERDPRRVEARPEKQRRSPRKPSASPRPSWSPRRDASTPRETRNRKRLQRRLQRRSLCRISCARWSRCSPRLTRCWSRTRRHSSPRASI